MSNLLKKGPSYLRMIKFTHTIFALPLALIAVAITLPRSSYIHDPVSMLLLVGKIIVCMVALRSAAMGFNRLVDRHIDALNPRTKSRELPSGEISVGQARFFVIFFLALFILAAYSINDLCALLSPLAIVAVLGYSYTKRFTWLCHFFLGLAIGLAPGAAWVAILARLQIAAVYWSAGLMFYISGFDILYACQDQGFDRQQGLYSIPARFGTNKALWVARLSHVIALVFFVLAGWYESSSAVFYGGLIIVAVLFGIEHYLVRPGKLEKIPIAFFHINASISSILLLAVLADLFWRGIYP